MKKDESKKRKLIFFVIFFSSIIFITSLFFIKHELTLTSRNKSLINFNWQQLRDEFNQMTNIIKQNYQSLSDLNFQTVNTNTSILTEEEMKLLKKKIEEININTKSINANESTNQ